jgi:hypothetical protein
MRDLRERNYVVNFSYFLGIVRLCMSAALDVARSGRPGLHGVDSTASTGFCGLHNFRRTNAHWFTSTHKEFPCNSMTGS